jgi:hypothetical protein
LDIYYEGIEEELCDKDKEKLENIKNKLKEEVREAYENLSDIIEQRLTENCPKWNNGYEGYDENGEPILDDKGDLMRNMFG